ncbi:MULTISPECIES: lactonase family protein [unclassified Microbacterium]|uniref:lactonase family protein n=1 Tax=unclassified Microbacterium TaxID=2609290 RepID=UPI00214A94C8|nr:MULTISPECIES: lactonase family protein [unclassified Microbacterium]MCR2810600.1 lactonase family protein [Microbacterium sp. zg.B185]WIM18137.1 lactonase family protein [Microbacterium sp. zg-B185]
MADSSLVLVANAGDGSISTFRLEDGSLRRLAVTAGLAGCSTFAVDSARDLVYAAVQDSGQDGRAGILTLRLDRRTGALEAGPRRDLPGGKLNYLALSRHGAGLLGASYDGGYGISCPITDGVVGDPVSRVAFPNLHSVLPSTDGRFAYFVSLGADLVAQYALGDDLRLAPLEPATVAAPAGSGPRHLVLNDAEDALYVLTEFSGQVLHFARDPDSGTLGLRDATDAFDPSTGLRHSRFGADPTAEHLIWGADLHPGADGRYLWCSERTESTLGAVAVADDGSVSAPDRFVTTEPQPRGFAVSPDGAHLVAAGERSTTISLYAVTGDRLELLQRAETGRGANWVRFV